jgi:hypothetical protein
MLNKNKIFKTTGVALLATLVFLLFLTSYTKVENKCEHNTTRIKLISSLPYFKDNKEFIYFRDSIGIVYYKNHILYEFPEHYNIQNDTTMISEWVKYKYLLFNKKDAYGYIYDSINAVNGRKIALDSFLNKTAFRGQSIFKKSDGVLISSIKTRGNYDLIEKYKCKVKKDETYPDTTIVYYTNKMKEVEHTLSKELDEDKKMKVKKIRALYNSQIIKGIPVPNYEIMFELKEDTITNLEKYKLFIEKHKK